MYLINAYINVNKGQLKILFSTFFPQICVSILIKQESTWYMMLLSCSISE